MRIKPLTDVVAIAVLAAVMFGGLLPGESALAQVKVQDESVPAGNEQATSAEDVLRTPIAEVDEPRHDFGEVWVNEQLNHTFTIRNTGNAPLKIVRVKPGCGCTKKGKHPNEIAPGETGEFSFTLNTKRMRKGFTKSIAVTTNDPNAKQIRLLLAGKIRQYIDVEPSLAQFGRVKADSVLTRKIVLTNNTDDDLQLSIADDQQMGCYKVELVEVTPGKQFELNVTATPPYQTGINRVQLGLNTNIKQQPKLDIICMATLPKRLELRPPQIQLSPRSQTQSIRKIWFTNNGDEPVNVVEASVTDDKLSVETQEVDPGKKYQFSVTIPAGYQPPSKDTAVVIKTDDDKESEIRLPVIAFQGPQRTPPERPASKLLGEAAPRMTSKTFDGSNVEVGGKQDKVQFLAFYASWCGFCKRALPKIEGLHKKYADNPNVEIIAINLDDRSGRRAKTEQQTVDHYKQLNLTMPMVLDSGKAIGKPYKVTSFPTMFLVGKTGEVEAVHIGAPAGFEQKVGQEIDLLLAGKSRADFPGAKPRTPLKPTRVTPVNETAGARAGSGG